MGAIRVVLADPDPYALAGVQQELERAVDVEVVAAAHDIGSLRAAQLDAGADALLFDPVIAGDRADALAILLRNFPPTMQLVALSQQHSPTDVRAAGRAGVVSFILKSDGYGKLAEILRTVAGGTRYVSPLLNQSPIGSSPDRDASSRCLTPRETEILLFVADDIPTREIARRLGVKPRTIDAHRLNIMRKLNIHTGIGLTRHVLQYRIATSA